MHADNVRFGCDRLRPQAQKCFAERADRRQTSQSLDLATDNRTYNGLNQDAGIAALSGGYDGNGNLANDGSRVMRYDIYNRLIGVTGSGVDLTLAYDPEGRLSKATSNGVVTTYAYDGSNLIAEYAGTGTLLRRYVHGAGVDEPLVWYEGSQLTSPRYFAQNYQGSVIGYSDSSGSLLELYKYGPWGEPLVASPATPNTAVKSFAGARFRYTGQTVIPEAKLYYYKARVYDPAFGRFLQTDPIGTKDDLDLYAYVGDDPVNKTDPTGLEFCRNCMTRAARGSSRRTTNNRDGSRSVTRTSVSYQNCGGSACGRSESTAQLKLLPQNQTAAGIPAAPTEAVTQGLLNLSTQTGKTVEVSSGYRSQSQQDALKDSGNSRAATQSQHTVGDAADIRIDGMTQKDVANAAANSGQFERVNKYSNGDTHVDMKDAGPGTTTYQDWKRTPYE